MNTPEHKEPFYIGVDIVEEHEDGGAIYSFLMDDKTSEDVKGIGLELILYCGIAGVDIQDVFDWILKEKN